MLSLVVGAVLVGCHYALFSRFFPNANGQLGHDHALFLPYLLDGFYWYQANGLGEIPWFTPSFCGGVPRFANRYLYYSVPQFVTFLTDPVTSLRLTLALFATLGFWGCHRLLRRTFMASRASALFGATVFLFNGLFAHRLIIGHLEFHAFMLIPGIAAFLLRPIPGSGPTAMWRLIGDAAIGGLALTYLVTSGLAHLPIPAGICLASLALLSRLIAPRTTSVRMLAGKLALAAVVTAGLSIAKITAALSSLRHFPREFYPLPGIARITDVLRLLTSSLFWKPPHDEANELLLNTPWMMERHEFEYGVTWVPLLVLLLGGLAIARRAWAGSRNERSFEGRVTGGRAPWRPIPTVLSLTALGALLFTPIALNLYTPEWNAFLKRIPIIKNSSQNVRLFCTYIPLIAVMAAWMLDRALAAGRARASVAGACIVAVVLVQATVDRSYYQAEHYDPSHVLEAYERVRSGEWSPVITHIEAHLDDAGEAVLPLDRNDSLTRGHSQMLCDETVFGYRLERFPKNSLHPGPTLAASNGVLNVKNPACYLFPRENGCQPGEHFTVARISDATAFVSFAPFPFRFSRSQRLANWTTGIWLLAIVFFLLASFVRTAVKRGDRLP